MAQRPSNVAPYTFAARTLIRPNKVTVLPYTAPAGPDVVMKAVPTITRCFYDDARPWIKSEAPGEPASRASSMAPRSKMRPSTRSARARTPIGRSTSESTVDSTTTDASPPTVESPTRLKRRASARLGTPSPSNPTPSASAAFTSTVPGVSGAASNVRDGSPKRRRVTRSLSRSELRQRSPPSEGASATASPSPESVRLDREIVEDLEVKRAQKKCLQTDEEKAKGVRFFTTWFSSKGDYVLSAPPRELLRRPDVKLGDLFFHVSAQSSVPQIWICEEQDDEWRWKTVSKGFIRAADKRRLIVNVEDTENKYPSFVTETWYNKRLKEERTRAKGKVKASR